MGRIPNNITINGNIAGKPRLTQKKNGGVFLGGFTLKYHPNRKYPPLFIPCVVFNEELAVYMAETCKEGDWLTVLKGSLMRDGRNKGQQSANTVSIVIWDIDDPALDRDLIPETMDSDEEYIAY